MEPFINDDFLLTTKEAKVLYHEYAEGASICDYHTHLDSSIIEKNQPFTSITKLWLEADHYKWRLMRACGIAEEFITGNADEFDKFCKWAETISEAIGNPLYHWTALELARFFDVDEMLGPGNAREIFHACQKKLNDRTITPKNILHASRVTHLCTTDDPIDSLSHHVAIQKDENFRCRILPTFRPDMALAIRNPEFVDWIDALSQIAHVDTTSFCGLTQALSRRMNFFGQHGCKTADHAIDRFCYREASENQIEEIYRRALQREALSNDEEVAYCTKLLTFFAEEYARRGWVMQLHIGVLRNVNSINFKLLGKDAGFDVMGDYLIIEDLVRFFDRLEQKQRLPKTIVYTIDPTKNSQLLTALSAFNRGIRGKMQLGPAWWFNDSIRGIQQHLADYASIGILGTFVGMVTDSRSFLSFVRHEYFRRILCDVIGRWIAEGQLPKNYKLIGRMVQQICYENAIEYFGF